ncbi:alpha-tocopherol transfer protein-like [Babylonia areolata]|uniref:alpha-tocopherol transfer protein-like n=1 Tax=Babylonia areolata TaxID=304850 RepID=UPI003FD1E003
MSSQAYTCTLSPELLEKAMKELNEDPKTRHLEIKTLRERLQQVPGYKGRTDDGFLLRFLRCKKFDQERAFKQVMTYYTMRKENADVYDNLTPKRVRNVMEAGVMGVLKDRAPDGTRVLYFRPGKWDPAKASLSDVIGNNFLTLSKIIEEEETQVNGVTLLADMNEMGWEQAKNMSPFYARKVTTLLQEAFPARFKGLHYVNEPTFFDVVFAVIKPFLKEKILKRISMHGKNLDKLHEKFPRDMLPEDLGGALPPFTAEDWIAKMMACEQQFVEENKFGMVDLTIPAKEQKKADATEALGGTFRKLNVD